MSNSCLRSATAACQEAGLLATRFLNIFAIQSTSPGAFRQAMDIMWTRPATTVTAKIAAATFLEAGLDMPALTIKNMPDEVYRRLKASARLNRRSLNNEAIVLLERSLGHRRRSAAESLAALRRLHERLRDLPPLDDELLERAKG
jgi:antitoxin FitA